jgi:hypothetical protein
MSRSFLSKIAKPNVNSPAVDDYQFKDNVSNICFALSALFICLGAYFVYKNVPLLPPQIPLFFSQPWGFERLGDRILLWAIPGCLGIFFFINYAFSLLVYKQELIIARLLGSFLLLWSVLGLFIVWNIVNLVILPVYW